MKIVSFNICPFVQRVIGLLEAKGLSYEIEYISHSDKPQWFLDISPNGQVPVLITDSGKALFESDAIAEYLEEAYPPLQADVSPEDKAINRAWAYLGTKHYLTQCGSQRSPDAATLKERSNNLSKAFDRMEKQLGDQPFFNGDALSVVDVAWLPLLHRVYLMQEHSGYDFIGDRPKLKAWQQNLLASGLTEKSVPKNFNGDFSDFYLNENTYLGRRENKKDELHSDSSLLQIAS